MKKIFFYMILLINFITLSGFSTENKKTELPLVKDSGKKLIPSANNSPVSVLMLDQKMLKDLEDSLRVALGQLYKESGSADPFVNVQKIRPITLSDSFKEINT